MAKRKKIPVSDLILDPNNPRFVHDFRKENRVAEKGLVESDPETLKSFSIKPPSGRADPEITYIDDLYDSMRQMGYQDIDQIAVRPIEGSEKYLVLEGNRRVATVKKILELLSPDAENPPKGPVREQLEKVVPTMLELPYFLVDTKNKSDEELEEEVNRILGIRHHGLLKEWEPLNRANHLFETYLSVANQNSDTFEWVQKFGKNVAERFSIKDAEVKNRIRVFVVYNQINERSSIPDDHYSIIEEAVKATALRTNYFSVDDKTFEFAEESLDRLEHLCQFQERDASLPKKLIPGPPEMRRFNQLIKSIYMLPEGSSDRNKANNALDEFLDLENEENTPFTLDKAVATVSSITNVRNWLSTAQKLLEDQKNSLSVSDINRLGNDKAQFVELWRRVTKIRAMIKASLNDI